jgi:ribosomal protein S18 acetylase RimI-like enzyme
VTLAWHIRHGLLPEQIPDAARLYWQAFAGKLGWVLGPDARALAFFSLAIRPDLCLCAVSDDGQLLAIAGLCGPAGGFAGGRPEDLAMIYGHFGAKWRSMAMEAVPRDEDPSRLLIDGLCVDALWRGQGIGSRLIAQAQDLARQGGFAAVQIDVAEQNHPAIRLYQRLGYRIVNRQSTGPLRWLFGVSATFIMVKDVGGQDVDAKDPK